MYNGEIGVLGKKHCLTLTHLQPSNMLDTQKENGVLFNVGNILCFNIIGIILKFPGPRTGTQIQYVHNNVSPGFGNSLRRCETCSEVYSKGILHHALSHFTQLYANFQEFGFDVVYIIPLRELQSTYAALNRNSRKTLIYFLLVLLPIRRFHTFNETVTASR